MTGAHTRIVILLLRSARTCYYNIRMNTHRRRTSKRYVSCGARPDDDNTRRRRKKKTKHTLIRNGTRDPFVLNAPFSQTDGLRNLVRASSSRRNDGETALLAGRMKKKTYTRKNTHTHSYVCIIFANGFFISVDPNRKYTTRGVKSYGEFASCIEYGVMTRVRVRITADNSDRPLNVIFP